MSDPSGILQFADKPEAAPVMHFGGPWTIELQRTAALRPNRESTVYLALATPGLGAGTKVLTGFEKLVPQGLSPKAEFTFPVAKPGTAPVTAAYDFKGRC
jgi:hypothetical protein